MTICIAALYENGKGCILASDKMVTVQFPMGYEYENKEVQKIVEIEHSGPVYVLTSGNILFADEILEEAKRKVTAGKIIGTVNISEIIRTSYQSVRRQVIIHNELEPRGLDLPTYIQNQQKLLPQLALLINQVFKTYNPRVEFVVAGKDEGSCCIYTITNPGQKICHNVIGYVAIGTGGPHAIYQFLDSEYKKSMEKKEVLEIVELAKKRSEKAPGVGKATEIREIGGTAND